MAKVQNSHDQFFKETFKQKEVVKEYILRFLPKSLASQIELSSLVYEDSQYTDEKLQNYFSDIVYSAHLKKGKKPIKITLLFEHKSMSVAYPHFQLLRYMLEIWNQEIDQKEKPKLIVPILIFHGPRKWKMQSFGDYFGDLPYGLQEFLPDFKYHLTDLSQIEDSKIMEKLGFLSSAFLLMKYIRNNKLLIQRFTLLFPESPIFQSNQTDLLLVYFLKNTEIGEKQFHSMIEEIPVHINNKAMTTYDKIIQTGVKKGLEQGSLNHKIQTCRDMIENGMDFSLICKILRIDSSFLEKVKNGTIKES